MRYGGTAHASVRCRYPTRAAPRPTTGSGGWCAHQERRVVNFFGPVMLRTCSNCIDPTNSHLTSCMEPPMKVQGSCHCGDITYEAEVDPDSVHVCNCSDCQMLTGSGFRVSAHAPKGAFRLLTGQPKAYIKTADSGTKRRHWFCPNCGTPVTSTADTDDPATYSLRVGCLKQRAQLAPKKRNWCTSALPWAQNISVLPATDTQ